MTNGPILHMFRGFYGANSSRIGNWAFRTFQGCYERYTRFQPSIENAPQQVTLTLEKSRNKKNNSNRA